MAQPQISLKTNGIQGVELLPTEYVPGNVRSAITVNDTGGMLPYTVVVRNTGSLPITGLDVRYEIFTKGDMIVNNFFYGSPVDLASAESIPVIAPNETAVIGPSHVINEELMSRRGISLSERHKASAARRVGILSKADRVVISIDSIIRSDGVLRGPDRSGTLRGFQQEFAAYREFRDDLLKRFEKGESDAVITSWLGETAQTKVTSPAKNEAVDRSPLTKRMFARLYLMYMKQGRQYAWENLKAARPDLTLHRIMNVRKEAQP